VLRLARPEEESGLARCEIGLGEGTCSIVAGVLRMRNSLGSDDACVT
jgi:hypothetical protein